MDVMVVFPTTYLTLKAEKTLESAGVPFRTVLKPRKISSDCGLALRIGETDIGRSRAALLSDGLRPVRFYRESDGEWECFFTIEEQAG